MISARNGTSGPDGAIAIAAEVGERLSSITSMANAKTGGRPLFGGFSSGDAVAKVAGTWTYQGDAGAVTGRIGENEKVQVNVTAGEVFGFNAGQDLFTLLETVLTQVQSQDSAGLGQSIADLHTGLDRLLVGRAKLGATSIASNRRCSEPRPTM